MNAIIIMVLIMERGGGAVNEKKMAATTENELHPGTFVVFSHRHYNQNATVHT
jgi:hypothetical protein